MLQSIFHINMICFYVKIDIIAQRKPENSYFSLNTL